MVNAGELNMEKLVDIAPMVKASSLNQITEQLDMRYHSMGSLERHVEN